MSIRPSGRAALDLIRQAHGCLAESASATTANERFAAAHLAALRAAAAVLAARARPARDRRSSGSRSRGPRNVWEVLPVVAPELAEWAELFAANAGKRAAAQAGLTGVVSERDADDLLREAEAFLGLACALLEAPYQAPLARSVAALLAQ